MFECIEMPSLISEKYQREKNQMANYEEMGSSVIVRADLPYERRMELLHEQRMGEMRKARKVKMGMAVGLTFVTLLAVLGIFPQIEVAYVAGAFILTAGAFIVQGNYTYIGIINSRMEILATENASCNSNQSPIREGREKATWRARRR